MWNKDENQQDEKARAEQVVQAALRRAEEKFQQQRSQREIQNDKVQ